MVAANISTDLAFVKMPRQRVKHTVKTATIARRMGMLVTVYKAIIAAIGKREERLRTARDAIRKMPCCE